MLVNGANSAVYDTIDLSSAGSLAAHGYLVIAGANVTAAPARQDRSGLGQRDRQIQNGAPDGLALVDTRRTPLIDALSYEGAITAATLPGFPAPVSLVEGTALPVGDRRFQYSGWFSVPEARRHGHRQRRRATGSSVRRKVARAPQIPRVVLKRRACRPTNPSSLDKQGISVAEIHRNATPAFLYEAALKFEKGTAISSTGALIAYSGKKTGRSPKDKRIVDEPEVRDDVWWGNVNIKLDPHSFLDQPRARDRLPQHARAAVRRRRLRRLGSEVPAQGPRHLRARLPRAVHAQHADPPDRRSELADVRRARLRHLQRGRLPGEPPHRRA